MVKRLGAAGLLAGSAILVALLPTVIFVGSALYRGMGVPGTVAALGDQYAADRLNLFVVSALGLTPLLLTALLIFVRYLMGKSSQGSVVYTWAGIIPVALVTLFVNLEYWPTYLPARQFLGFPHGLEFVIGPFVFAPIGVLVGFLIAWTIGKRA